MSKKTKRSSDKTYISNSDELNEFSICVERDNRNKTSKMEKNLENRYSDEIFTMTDYSSDNDDSDDVTIKNEKQNNNNRMKIYIIALIILFVACSVLHSKLNFLYETDFKSFSYNDRFEKMKSRFSSLSKESWKMLNISLYKQIFKHEPIVKPAVIILVGAKDRVNQFLNELINEVIPNKCPSYLFKTDMENSDLISDLIIFLERNLHNKCAYLPDIDKIPPTLGPFLHGLTDELNALHKEMIYIFSLKINTNDDTSILIPETDRKAELFLVDRLRSLWLNEMGEERFVALHTRLTINVLAVI